MVIRPKWLLAGVLALLALAVLVTATPRRPTAAGVPSADLSSPEQALKSYWLVQDWLRRYRSGEVKHDGPQIDADELLRQVTAGSALSSFDQRPVTTARLAWSLETIEHASEHKAIALVRIRNLDRNPSALTPTPVELFQRNEEAGLYRYILTHEAKQWKVAEVWRVETDGTAKRLR
jgi:hypothetical protein